MRADGHHSEVGHGAKKKFKLRQGHVVLGRRHRTKVIHNGTLCNKLNTHSQHTIKIIKPEKFQVGTWYYAMPVFFNTEPIYVLIAGFVFYPILLYVIFLKAMAFQKYDKTKFQKI